MRQVLWGVLVFASYATLAIGVALAPGFGVAECCLCVILGVAALGDVLARIEPPC